MIKIIALLLAVGLLAGCDALQSAREQALQLQEDGESYINDNIKRRGEIRDINWDLIKLQVETLRSEGKYEDARAYLCKHYPPLVALGTLREAEVAELSQGLRAIDFEVAGCAPVKAE